MKAEIETLQYLDKQTLLDVLNAVRKSFAKNSPHYNAALTKALSKEVGPRGGKRYHCAQCNTALSREKVEVDHIQPMIPLGISPLEMTLKQVYTRCWVTLNELQILCTKCHDNKSAIENKQRRELKKLRVK